MFSAEHTDLPFDVKAQTRISKEFADYERKLIFICESEGMKGIWCTSSALWKRKNTKAEKKFSLQNEAPFWNDVGKLHIIIPILKL